jgi:hypothetical protein
MRMSTPRSDGASRGVVILALQMNWRDFTWFADRSCEATGATR